MTGRKSESAMYYAELSQMEAKEFAERQLKCPQCGFPLGFAFSDCTGHLKLKCRKCKSISVLNFAYFRRQRGVRRRITWN